MQLPNLRFAADRRWHPETRDDGCVDSPAHGDSRAPVLVDAGGGLSLALS